MKYLLYNYAQCKTFEPIVKLVDLLDFYEFEDEYHRKRTILMIQAFQNLKQYNLEQFKEYWSWLNINDSILWDYL